jgi:N-acetylglucosaminyl-diphospho-decaprenol L-rhamnosyltransferase
MRRLSIVIVSYNSSRDLERCLGSLTRPAPAVDHEIVVVDNASTDGTPAYLRAAWPQVRLIEAGDNVGFARANNIAIRDTWSELVLLLNPDTEVPAGAVDALVAIIDARSDLAAVGPRIVDANGRAELSFGSMISPFAELRQKVLVTGHDRAYPGIGAIVERMTRRSAEVDWVSGACLLARRADIEAVGLLDERFFMYTEDVDVCAAMRQRGRRILFAADVEIQHRRGRSAASAPEATAAAYRRSQIAFYEKHHPRWAPLLKHYLKLRSR